MPRVYATVSISLDGYVAGPNQTLDDPLGRGGERLHEWAFRLAAWRQQHGLEGGETGPESELVERTLANTGAYVMGRRMFSGGSGSWQDDKNATGWWGDEPPFHAPVFVVTHHERTPLELEGTTFTFVTGGLAEAVEQAKAAAGDRDVQVAGGGSAIDQTLELGLVDELHLHVAPVLLGPGGVRLFEGSAPASFEIVETIGTPQATHVRYAVSA